MSYDGPGQRRGPKFAAEVRARQDIPVDAHQGDPMDFLRRLESAASAAAQGDHQERDEYYAKAFDWAVDSRNLFVAWNWLRSGDGDAPGLDGLRYSDIPPHDTWRFLRGLGQAVVSGEYQPGPLRPVEIPKGPGRGTRTLELPSIIDRTVGRAVVQAIRHFVDPGVNL